MLEKVINITPGSDYKKSTGNPKYFKKISQYGYHTVSSNDSIQISPASALLSSYGWKLKKFQNEANNIDLLFETDGFEFETNVLLNEVNQTSRFEYKIRKNVNGYDTEMLITVRITAPINKNYSNGKHQIKLNSLLKLFEQLKSINVNKPKLITDKDVIDSISFELKGDLTKEFYYINYCLLKFLEKYISFKIVYQNSDNDELISIKSIQIQ